MFKRPTPSEERSADERARAAAERAARRAAREGHPVEPPPPETFAAGAAADAAANGGEPDHHHEPEPAHEPEPIFEPPAEPLHEPEPIYEAPSESPPAPEPPPAHAPEPMHEPEPTAVHQAYEPEPYQPEPDEPEPVVHEPEPAPEPAPPAEDPHGDPRTHNDDLWTDEYLLDDPVAEVPASQSPADPEPTSHEGAPTVGEQSTAEHERTQAWTPADEPVGDETVEWRLPGAEPEPPPARPAPLPPRTPSVPARGERWRPRDRPPAAVAPEPRGPRRHLSRIGAVVGLLTIALFLFLFNAIFQPFHADGGRPVSVAIPAGADAGKIGDILAERGVIDSAGFFSANATITGRRGNLRPGNYTLAKGMSYGAALDALSKGPKAAKAIPTYDLTVVEGRSARETAARIAKTDMEGNYLSASRSKAALRRARRLGLPRNVKTTEGFLFPATYKLPEGATAADLVQRQLEGYADNTAEVSYARARRLNLTRYDVLIIASMIEREAQLDRERPLVASVIYNRLKQGIPLGIDATIRYATNNWTRPIRVSELEADGPYNTRLNRGLPPTPIGNPGLASIKAAAKPAKSDFLYYVVKPDSKGAHAFSKTDAEFQRDVQRYNQAREDSGGQAP